MNGSVELAANARPQTLHPELESDTLARGPLAAARRGKLRGNAVMPCFGYGNRRKARSDFGAAQPEIEAMPNRDGPRIWAMRGLGYSWKF